MRWIVGILLVCAALLKAVEIFNAPAAAMVNPLGRYFVPVQIGAELALGLLVLSGIYWAKLRSFLLILFTAFAGYSLYQAMNGATSCGCFGPLRVHPWWTFFLDIMVVLGIAIFSVSGSKERGIGEAADSQFGLFHAARHKVVAGAMCLSVVATAALARYVDGRTASASGQLAMTDELVVLEPELWIGERLPIAEFVDVNLKGGEWVAVLHRHDCPACQEAMPRYEQLAATGRNVALIEVPPYGDHKQRESATLYGRLDNDREWFVQTPVELHLLNGIVTAVKTHAH